MKSNLIKLIVGVLGVCLAYAAPLLAQVAGASLSGTITDASGGAIAGAQISAKNNATGVVTSTTANTDGNYEIPNLLPGDYHVTVSAPNFGSKATTITLTVGAKQVLNLRWTWGSRSRSSKSQNWPPP